MSLCNKILSSQPSTSRSRLQSFYLSLTSSRLFRCSATKLHYILLLAGVSPILQTLSRRSPTKNRLYAFT
jgi:hypothetical protein